MKEKTDSEIPLYETIVLGGHYIHDVLHGLILKNDVAAVKEWIEKLNIDHDEDDEYGWSTCKELPLDSAMRKMLRDKGIL